MFKNLLSVALPLILWSKKEMSYITQQNKFSRPYQADNHWKRAVLKVLKTTPATFGTRPPLLVQQEYPDRSVK